ncbi:MAG: methionyl-tRNA formyltransferase [Holophagales bacterium]|nr:methionyl-tRNA formyltransferase [Holophagales bacterium]
MSPLRLAFFGTPEIAVPTLERLLDSRHPVVGVVSQPDRGRGRGRKPSPSPVAEVALRADLPLLRPEQVGARDCVEAMRAWRADLGVVVAFGQFLPKAVRELPSKGYLINAHASLLPRHRGAAPIARAILEGDAETGISVMKIVKEMDAGPVAAVARTPIGPRENTAELSTRLAAIAAELILEVVDAIAEQRVVWTEQDAARATHAAKIEKSDAVLDLAQDARALVRRIHALAPRPGAAVALVQDGARTELKLLRADALPYAAGESPAPGRIDPARDPADPPLRIATGDGWLVPLEVQRAGARPLAIADFLRGFALAVDARCERAEDR